MSRHAMHYRYSALFGVLVVIASILIAPSAAQAAVQRAWAVANQTNDVLVGPDNLPVALNCYVNGDYNAFNSDGTQRFVIQEDVNGAVDIGCGNNLSWHPFRITDSISASGNIAMSADTDSSHQADSIRLYDNTGSLQWEYNVLNECSNPANIGASPVISNGVVIFTYASCLNWGRYYLMGLDEDDHSVVFNVSLGNVANTTSLQWYEDGVTFMINNGIRYFSSAGVEDTNRNITYTPGSLVAQHVDGTVVYRRTDDLDPDICYLVFHTYGFTDREREIDCEMVFWEARTLPNGDLAALTDRGDDTDPGIVTIFHQSSMTANTVIEIDHPGGGAYNFTNHKIDVDANGNIFVLNTYKENLPNPTPSPFERTAFRFYDSSGELLFSWTSGVYGKQDVSALSDYGFSLSYGGVYLNDTIGDRIIHVRHPLVAISYSDSVHWSSSAGPGLDNEYVALGDSYSSGEGSYNYDIDSSTCHQSSDAYALYVADELELGTPLLVACSGAVTDDIMDGQSAYVNTNTEKITLTIGGNDAGFAEIMKACVNTQQNIGYFCSDNSAISLPLSERMVALAGERDTELEPLKAPGTDKNIHSVFDVLMEITTRAPNADVYIAGYPKLFGENSANYEPFLLAPGGYYCIVNASFTSQLEAQVGLDDAVWLNDQSDLLNTIISNAVDDAVVLGRNVHYVPASNFNTHGVCDSGSQWINDVDLEPYSILPLPESFHPNSTGMSQGYGNAFVNEMD